MSIRVVSERIGSGEDEKPNKRNNKYVFYKGEKSESVLVRNKTPTLTERIET